MSLELAIRFVGGIVAGVAAWEVALWLMAGQLHADPSTAFLALFIIAAATFGIAFLLIPYATTRPFLWALEQVTHTSPSDLLAAAAGGLLGLLAGTLLSFPASRLPGLFGSILPLGTSILLAYLGALAAQIHKRELMSWLGLPREPPRGQRRADPRVLLDTSAIIDGRVADLARTGFLSGPFLVPRFILGELQRIADSPDALRRNRGRHGLEILTRLQKDPAISLEIFEADADAMAAVDAQLVSVARTLHCPIITTDFNLNRVAGLQGVKVLNINELANAVKSVVLPGEEMAIKIIQEGKEFGQGVGYLEDGTMVVVENGRHLLNATTEVVVSRVLQTAAGRLIFAQPKLGYPTASASGRG